MLNTVSENLLPEKSKEIVLLGDFNIDLLKYEKDRNITDFLDQMYSTSLVPHITSPPGITSHSTTLIDNIFSTNISENAISRNIVISISDHLAKFLFLPINQFKTNNNKNIYQRNFKSFNQQIFLEDIQNLNWNNVLELEKKDIDNSFDKFFLIVETLLDTYAPIQKLTKAESKLKSKPWLTRGIMTSIKKKNIIYKKFIKAKNSTEKNILYNEFKRYRNLVTKLSRISKAKHYHHYFTDHKKNMLKTWEGIKLLVNINKRNNKTVNCLNVDGVEETDPFVISNHFNKFFSTIAQQIEGKIVKTNKHFSDFLSEPLQSNFFLTPTLPDEIQEIIKSLNSKKATGPNSIPTKILKVFSKTISIPLANLINLSFECGIFPMSLKVASVTPIHKKGGSLDCNNYRPVSLISNLSKLIEKLVHNRLYNFLEKHKLLYEHQYGFQKKHSTNHALIDITE